MIFPCRARRAGHTQSNISIPESIRFNIPSISPKPITYLNLSFGRKSTVKSTMLFLSSGVSPIAKPPIA